MMPAVLTLPGMFIITGFVGTCSLPIYAEPAAIGYRNRWSGITIACRDLAMSLDPVHDRLFKELFNRDTVSSNEKLSPRFEFLRELLHS